MKKQSKLSVAVVVVVIAALLTPVFAADPVVPDQWKAMNNADLVLLATQLGAQGQAGQANRTLLGNYFAAKYFGSTAATKSLNPKQWKLVVASLLPDRSAETREQWRTKIRAAFVGDGTPMKGISYWDLRSRTALCHMLGDRDREMATIRVMFVKNSTGWQSCAPAELAALTDWLTALGEASLTTQAKLGAHATSKYIDDVAAAKAVKFKAWERLAYGMRFALTPETKAKWVSVLRSAFVPDDKALLALGRDDVYNLIRALRRLGDKDAPRLKKVWDLGNLPDFTTLSGDDLVMCARTVAALGDMGAVPRGKFIAHIDSKYAGSVAAARGLTAGEWGGIARAFHNDLSLSQRAKWIGVIRSAFATEDMGVDELLGLSGGLTGLGDADSMSFVLAWIKERKDWKSWKLTGFTRLAGALKRFSDTEANEARATLAAVISARYGSNVQAIKAAGLPTIANLVRALSAGFSAEVKGAWVAGIRQAFAPSNEAIVALKSGQCAALVNTLIQLGDPNVGAVASVWFDSKAETDWSKTSLRDMTATIALAASAGNEKGAELMAKLGTAALAGEMSISEKMAVCQAFSTAWARMKQKAKAQQWAIAAYEVSLGTKAARDKADTGTLYRVAEILRVAGLTGKDKGYPSFAEALVGLARQGKLKVNPYQEIWRLCLPLGTDEAVATVRAELADPEGSPRLEIAALLTSKYSLSKAELKKWQAFLAEQIKAATHADKKALWTIARAHTRQKFDIEGMVVDARPALSGLQLALTTAESPKVRMLAVERIVGIFGRRKRHKLAESLLVSIKDQFSGDDLASLNTLQGRMRAAGVAHEASVAKAAVRRIQLQKRWKIASYRKKLRSAKAAKEPKRVARLTAALAALENKATP